MAYSQRVNARLWDVQTGQVRDLNPPGYEQAAIQAMAPGVQVGGDDSMIMRIFTPASGAERLIASWSYIHQGLTNLMS